MEGMDRLLASPFFFFCLLLLTWMLTSVFQASGMSFILHKTPSPASDWCLQSQGGLKKEPSIPPTTINRHFTPKSSASNLLLVPSPPSESARRALGAIFPWEQKPSCFQGRKAMGQPARHQFLTNPMSKVKATSNC